MNKRKKLLSLLALILTFSLMFTSIAFAASKNGTFSGYSIINVFVNGKAIQSDVPAINFKGRTMVPVRFVSEALGADVDWDGNTDSAYINMSDTESGLRTDIETLQIYASITKYYRYIDTLGAELRDSNALLALSVMYALQAPKEASLDSVVRSMEKNQSDFNTLLEIHADMLEISRESGIDFDKNINLNNYATAIQLHENALSKMRDFLKTRNMSYLDQATNEMGKAAKLVNDVRQNAHNNTEEIFDKAMSI